MDSDRWRSRLRGFALPALLLGYFLYIFAWGPLTRHLPYYLRSLTEPAPDAANQRLRDIDEALSKLGKAKIPSDWTEHGGDWSKYAPFHIVDPDSVGHKRDQPELSIAGPLKDGRLQRGDDGLLICIFDDENFDGLSGECLDGTGHPKSFENHQVDICEWKINLEDVSAGRIEGRRRLDADLSDPKCVVKYGDKPIDFVWLPFNE